MCDEIGHKTLRVFGVIIKYISYDIKFSNILEYQLYWKFY